MAVAAQAGGVIVMATSSSSSSSSLRGRQARLDRAAPSAAAACADGRLYTRRAIVHLRKPSPRPSLRPSSGVRAFLAPSRRRSAPTWVVRAATAEGPDEPEPSAEVPSLAPLAPSSPEGEFLTHILSQEPHLFQPAVDQQLERLSAEKSMEEKASQAEQGSGNDIVLYRRIEEVKRAQRQRSVQDLMYASVLNKFFNIGIDLLPPLDENFSEPGPVDLNALTTGVHTPEALELVREHLVSVLGGGAPPFSNAMIRLSKLQAAQVYAASIMFGYFLRRVNRNFTLERQLGTLTASAEDTIAVLEDLFSSAAAADSLDAAEEDVKFDPDQPLEPPSSTAGGSPTLRSYIEAFDSQTLADTAKIVSKEGLSLAEQQTGALFGSIEDLQREMQSAVEDLSQGREIGSPQELMQYVQEVVADEKVATLTVSYGTQRRVVLEAVAFGSFLRDCESYVDGYNLLTPFSSASGGGAPPMDSPPPAGTM